MKKKMTNNTNKNTYKIQVGNDQEKENYIKYI